MTSKRFKDSLRLLCILSLVFIFAVVVVETLKLTAH
jgi:hypothetical protein